MHERFEMPRVVTPPIARHIGVTPSRVRAEIRRGNWRRICRGGVLTRPEPPTRADLAAIGIWLGGQSAALSGWDAVRACGLGEPVPPATPVLVLSRDADNRSVDGLIVRRTARPYSRTLTPPSGPYPLTPVVPAARAVADAALTYESRASVVALVTSSVQKRRCTPEDLVAEYRSGPRGDSLFLRLALEDVLDGARSLAEATAARKLTRAGIPPFQMNVEFIDPSGARVYSPDIYWPELRAILEVESREWHLGEREWKATMKRHNDLTRLNFAVTHYPPSVVNGSDDAWLIDVADWLSRRARELDVPMPSGRGPRRDAAPVII